ncbi:cytochrome P450 [Hypoxylon sp. FL1284]|nr:cytochrome P450 [Hypoxylon sp. FL1284]
MSGGLTESEIYGNMFAFNFACHDTTAHAFTFALYFLATHPKVQDWLSEELRAVLRDRRQSGTIEPTFRGSSAVCNQSQSLTVGGKTVVLPPNSMIASSYGSFQTDPRFWGPESLIWKPRADVVSKPGEEDFSMPVRGAFIGWSYGVRDCPGKRFSLVKFVATMAALFLNWRVDPVVVATGETPDGARQRVDHLIETDSDSVLLLQMLHPERAPLVWKRR